MNGILKVNDYAMSASPEYATVENIVSYNSSDKGNVNLSSSELKKEFILKNEIKNGILNNTER